MVIDLNVLADSAANMVDRLTLGPKAGSWNIPCLFIRDFVCPVDRHWVELQ